jgi:hypothetical protein
VVGNLYGNYSVTKREAKREKPSGCRCGGLLGEGEEKAKETNLLIDHLNKGNDE